MLQTIKTGSALLEAVITKYIIGVKAKHMTHKVSPITVAK